MIYEEKYKTVKVHSCKYLNFFKHKVGLCGSRRVLVIKKLDQMAL